LTAFKLGAAPKKLRAKRLQSSPLHASVFDVRRWRRSACDPVPVGVQFAPMLRVTLAALHLFALAFGLGAVYVRGRSLTERPLTLGAVRRAFVADSWWGIAAGLWIATGLWRLFAGTEKATSYYLHNDAFFAKMALLIIILALEIWPMMTLIRWRKAVAKSSDAWQPDEIVAGRITKISYIQAALGLAMVVAAVLMARGYGYRGP